MVASRASSLVPYLVRAALAALAALGTLGTLSGGEARAEGNARGDGDGGDDGEEPRSVGVERVPALYDKDPFATRPGYGQVFATMYFGDGLRFNNPYRLATPLGGDAESVSRTAAYVDFGMGITFERPLALQHGMALRSSFSVEGVRQAVVTPSYLAWRRWGAFAAHGRAGFPVVLTPSVTWGLEAAGGGTWFFLGGFGVSAEVVGDVFYGAGTADARVVTYPVLSGQLGLVAAYEVLP
jgi:hypothetical protein